jgi:hypothetical protein
VVTQEGISGLSNGSWYPKKDDIEKEYYSTSPSIPSAKIDKSCLQHRKKKD